MSTKRKTSRSRRELGRNLLLLSAAFLLCLLLLELALRAVWEKPGYGYPPGLHIPDESKGYAYRPNFTGYFPSRLYQDVPIHINSMGLRDSEHSYQKPQGVTRILALGDSVTFGAGVQVEDTYLKKLEIKLKQEGHAVETINAAVNSYEFDQEYAYYTEEGYKYQPDILLVGVVLNDAGRVDLQKIREQRFGGGALSYQSLLEAVRNNCFLCNFLYFNALVIENRLSRKGADYNEQYFQNVYGLWEGEPWNYTQQKMASLAEFAQGQNAQVVFAVFPYTQQFSNSPLQWERLPQQKLKEFGREQNVTVIDLLPALDVPDYRSLYLHHDNLHLSPAGHEVVSEALYKAVEKMIHD